MNITTLSVELSLTNVPASEFDLVAPIYVTKEAEAEAIVPRGVREAIDSEAGRSTVEGVTDTCVRFVVVH